MQNKGLWMLLMIGLVLGILLWSFGGSEVLDLAPFYWKKLTGKTGTVTITNHTVDVEVASTQQDRVTGLSNRHSLPYDRGMLFVFSEPDVYSFTMRDTEVPLDIIWINDGVVGYVYSRAQPGEEIITPPIPATYVLEVNQGLAGSQGWRMGDEVVITFDKE